MNNSLKLLPTELNIFSGPVTPAVFMGSFGNTISISLDSAGTGVLYMLLDTGDIKSVNFATGDVATVVNAGEDAFNLQYNNGY